MHSTGRGWLGKFLERFEVPVGEGLPEKQNSKGKKL